MEAIIKKELKGYFQSPIGYIFVGVFMALCSMFFVSGALAYQTADLSSIFANINVVYLFLVSILTMGLFSLERSRKTDQLLLTAPVSVRDIVVGKYLAALSVFGVTLLISLVFPFILNIYGSPSTSEMVGSYIGFILLWSAFIAIGLFISALTESQMIAAVITFGVLLLIYYVDWIAVSIANETIADIVSWFSLMGRYNELQTGILSLENVVYYLSFIFIFLFLTIQVIKRRQYSDAKFRINNVVITSAIIAGTLLVNAIVGTISDKLPLKLDMTEDKIYEFSAQTKQVMEELDAPIEVYALYPDNASGELVVAIKEYLKQYEEMNDKLSVTYVDPYEDPAFVRKFGTEAGVGTVIIEQGERFRVLPLEKLYTMNQQGTVAIDLERQLTSAIRFVTGIGNETKAYFIEGHDEYSAPELKDALTNEGYDVSTINLSNTDIPEDATVLISMSPAADFTAHERDVLDAYLMKGGKAAFIYQTGTPKMERLDEYLKEWGIAPNNDFVYEADSSHAMRSNYGVPVPSPMLQEHTITEKLINSDIPFAAARASSFTINENNMQHTYITSLLETSENSWGITDLSRTTTTKAEGDINGPLTIAAISEKSDDTNGAIFVLGSMDSVETPGVMDEASYCNGDFVLNAFSYLTNKGDALNIRPKIISAQKLTMTESQVKTLSNLLQYVLPLLILIFGLIIWLRRRHL